MTLSPSPAPTPTPRAEVPAVGPVLAAEYRLLIRSIATRGRIVSILALSAVGLLTAVAVHAGSPAEPLRAGTDLVNGYIATLLPVAVLVLGAATLGDLLDDGSLVYLWLRPVPTWVHVVAAWAATVSLAIPLVVVPVTVAAAIVTPDSSLLIGTVLGGLVGVAAYAALFVTAGIRFRRALPWGLVYILIWEGFIASAGKTATKLALRSYIRSILSAQTGIHLKLGEFNLGVGIAVPLLVGAVALLYATWRLGRSDIP